MPKPNDDLWPSDLGNTDMVAPVAILREQASALGRKTNYILSGQVETHGIGGKIHHILYVVAPPLDNYKYEVLEVSHEAVFYPLWIRSDDAGVYNKEAKTQDEFMQFLKTILSSEKLKRVINSLIVQSQAG